MGKNNWVGFGPVYKHAENPEVKPRLFKRNQARMNYQYHVENGLNITNRDTINQCEELHARRHAFVFRGLPGNL